MSSLNSSLIKWGAQGSEYSSGYNYVEGEQPVDAWDNFITYHTIEEIHALQSVVNDRLETDSDTAHPTSPEVGHLSHRSDTANLPTSDESVYYRDGTNAVWHRFMKADGDTMTGAIDMGGYQVTDSSGPTSIGGAASINGARVEHQWFNKQEGGTVGAGSIVPIGAFELLDTETLKITQAHFTADGFTTAAPSNTGLVVVDDDSTTAAKTILAGDGATVFTNETGAPHTSLTNSSGAARKVIIGLDNGDYTTGTGVDEELYGGYTARIN